MATTEQITELRELINDTGTPAEYTAGALAAYIDAAAGNVRKAAGQVWTTRAGRYAGLVDVTEGSSSRKNSQLYKQALDMAVHFGGVAEEATPDEVVSGRTRIHPIVR